MTQITLEGIVGWDITAADVRRQLAESSGPVDLLIHSPGGSVYDGFAIHNAIRDHRRTGATVSATVTGLAASMATYIAMAADTVGVEDNAVFMVHNPYAVSMGDHRAMQKTADILGSLAGVLGRAYQAKTGSSAEDIAAQMDGETWLFGDEIVAAGYADHVVPAGDGADNRAEALALARGAFEHMTSTLRSADAAAQIDQIAALLPIPMETPMSKTPTAAGPAQPQPDPTEPTETQETGDPETPDLETAIQAALKDERERVSAIQARCAQVGMPELSAALIQSGAKPKDADAAIVDAWVSKGGPEIRHAQNDAPQGGFEERVAALVVSGKSRSEAIRATAAAHPELHHAYLVRVNARDA